MNSLIPGIQNRITNLRAVALVMGFLFCTLLSVAQPPSLTIGNVGVCNTPTVLVPLNGSNLSNIGAITLFISYDSLSLSFDTIENVDPQLNQIMAHAMSNPPRVSLVWSKTSGATFLNNTLLKLKFTVLQKTSALRFVQANCELATNAIPPQIITVNYSDGSVFSSYPAISADPENKTIFSQSNVAFQVSSPNATGFSWQESRSSGAAWTNLSESGTYTGTQTNILTIKKVPANYNQFLYRCILNLNTCPAISSSALLTVDSLTGIQGQPSQEILHLRISPNPVTDNTAIYYYVPEQGSVSLKIYSMTGKLMGNPVENIQASGSFRLHDNFVYLPAGIYFCKYVFKSTAHVYETCQKLIKTE
jgi:hypothetical protein